MAPSNGSKGKSSFPSYSLIHMMETLWLHSDLPMPDLVLCSARLGAEITMVTAVFVLTTELILNESRIRRRRHRLGGGSSDDGTDGSIDDDNPVDDPSDDPDDDKDDGPGLDIDHLHAEPALLEPIPEADGDQEDDGGDDDDVTVVITDAQVVEKLCNLKGDPTVDDNFNTVERNGTRVPREIRDVIVHVFDMMNDHFGGDQPPLIAMLPLDQEIDNEGRSSAWSSAVNFEYTIDGKPCHSDLLAIDSVYIDTSQIIQSEQGKTSVKMYIPKSTLEAIMDCFRTGTSWEILPGPTSDIRKPRFFRDDSEELVSFQAAINDEDCPKFFVSENERGNDKELTGRMLRVPSGSVQDVCQPSHAQHGIHQCTAFVNVALLAFASKEGDGSAPTPNDVDLPRGLAFSLLCAISHNKVPKIFRHAVSSKTKPSLF